MRPTGTVSLLFSDIDGSPYDLFVGIAELTDLGAKWPLPIVCETR